jgi:chemotaxis protein MotA
MTYFIGLFVATISIFLSIYNLRQSFTHYYDIVAFTMVIGGTLAVAVIIFPWKNYRDIKESFKSLTHVSVNDLSVVILECINFLKAPKYVEMSNLKGLASDILRDGIELRTLGLGKEKVNQILTFRIEQSVERMAKIANTVRSLSKYPPAFGLAGTVLGLVNIMRHVSEGADSKTAGTLMAVALIATLYGLLLSNLVINPAGEALLKSVVYQKKAAEIVLETIMLSFEDASLLEAQELLNSFVHPVERVNTLGSIGEDSGTV